MKSKAITIIILYLSLIISLPISNHIQTDNLDEGVEVVFEYGESSTQVIPIKNIAMETQASDPPSGIIQTLDLVSPSYTNLTVAEDNPIIEGSEIALTSQTNSAGHGVSSGTVDFMDLNLYTIDNDQNSNAHFSNRFAIKISIPNELAIQGFVVDISPTIREDINFYIRTSLIGTNLRDGIITGYIGNSAHTTNQLLYVPFSYCDGGASLILDAFTNYYFILEPTLSTSDTFFELTQSSDQPNDLDIFEWWDNNYELILTDVNFYLIADITTLDSDIDVDGSGKASANWDSVYQGEHSLLAWYEGSAFYAESYGSALRTVIPSSELLQVTTSPITTEYNDIATLKALVVKDDLTPAEGKTVTFSLTEDGFNWITLGSAITNSSGEAILVHQFDQLPGNYTTHAQVNDFSFDNGYVLVIPETITWEYINMNGNFRNNPGTPQHTSIRASVLVRDNEGNVVSNMDLEFYYKIDGSFEWIPHFYTTNSSGFADVAFAVDDVTVAHYTGTHYFKPASYEIGYIGTSDFGDTIIDKGQIDIELADYTVKYYDDVKLTARAVSLDVPWEGITIQFYYRDTQGWHYLDVGITNSTGYTDIIWEDMPLSIGSYLIRAEALETQLFESYEIAANLFVNQKGVSLYILNAGQLKENGEEIDLEYTSEMNLEFFVMYEDGKPAGNLTIIISGRLGGEQFYENIGYTTTNASGYAMFNDYKNLTFVGFQYFCKAEISASKTHEATELYFKINLIQCNPVIIFEDHLCVKGTYTELIAQVRNYWGVPLRYVYVEFILEGELYHGVSDVYGYIRVRIAPDLPVGTYLITCISIEDTYYLEEICDAYITILKGMPIFTLFDGYVINDGYLTIKALAVDSLGRPLAGLTVSISFLGWNEILTTNEFGIIEYIFQISGFNSGYYLSVLTFDGNSNWHDTTTTATVLIYEQESDLELLTTMPIIDYHESLLMEARLTTLAGDPLSNCIIHFVIIFDNGTILQLGENVTNSLGYVKFSTVLMLIPDDYEFGVLYFGAIDYGPSFKYTTLVIQKNDVLIYGQDFEAIIDSTTTFILTLTNLYGIPLVFEELSVSIWINNTWLFLGRFTSDQNGLTKMSLLIPFELGIYSLKIEFAGNDCYNSHFLIIEMTVVEPPPKIAPELSISPDGETIVDHEEIHFEVLLTNAKDGSALNVQVFVNGIFNGTFYIISGYGEYVWATADIGVYNLTFVSLEDSIYLVTMTSVTIEVIQNTPPVLDDYFFDDYICEGESFEIELIVNDGSGVRSVWLTLNGTIYELDYIDVSYQVTIEFLKQGIYELIVFAEDLQGYISITPIDLLHVLERKTQVLKYHFNSRILEHGQQLYFETLIYAVNPVSNVYFIINETEYAMLLGYNVNEQKSVWYINVDSLPIGTYELKVKIVEETNSIVISSIGDILVVIPLAPQITSIDWLVERNKNTDYISGTMTIESFFEIEMIEIWIDGKRITVTETSSGVYSFSGTTEYEKSHVLIIKVIDIQGRTLTNEVTLGDDGRSILATVSIVVAVLVFVALMSGGIFVTSKQMRKNRSEEFPSELDLPEITDNNDSDFASNTDNDQAVPDELAIEESALDEFPLLEDRRKQPTNVTVAEADLQEITEELLDEELDAIEIEPEPKLDEVKEYIAKVKEVGLMPGSNDGNGGVIKSIDDLATLGIEIDHRLLPEKERLRKLAEKELYEPISAPTLKEIAEEIEQTFVDK